MNKDQLAQELFDQAVGDRELNVAALSRVLDRRLQRTWQHVRGRARWPAGDFVCALLAIGSARLRNGNLTITIPLPMGPGIGAALEAVKADAKKETVIG